MKWNFLLISLMILISTGNLSGQSLQRTVSGKQSEPVGIIKGRVNDEETNDPLPYTNIVLYTKQDSSLVTGTITGSNGSFILEKIPAGRFYLEVKFIGYDKITIPDIRISPGQQQVLLDDIKLAQNSQKLQGVDITAERSPIEYKIDRKVINVSENLNSQGESAARALENAPSVTVDIDGNVMLRGSSSFTVLIDGKPSPLEGSDALKQIPASAVENIEIITNPSVKFDPDGLSGIINIVTKKHALNGLSGIANASAGTGDKYRGDLLLNYKTDGLTFYFGADYNDETRYGNLIRTMTSDFGDTTRYINSDGERINSHKGYTLKGGVTYSFDEINSVTLEGNTGQFSRNHANTGYFYEFDIPGNEGLYYLTESQDDHSADFYNLTLSHSMLFGTKDHNLKSFVYFENRKGISQNYQDQLLTGADWNPTGNFANRIFTNETRNPVKWRFQTDYSRPVFENGKLEAGYQFRYIDRQDKYSFNEWDDKIKAWVDNPDYSNSLDFKRNIQAAYGVLANEWDKFSVQAGIRAEYTFRKVNHQLSDEASLINRVDLFPSVHASKQIGKKDQILISYSRRINRPRGFYLNPFPNYMDKNNLRVGNPELEPEYVDSYEINYQKGLGKSSFISLEGYYRLTTNKITRIVNVTDEGLRVHTMDNLNKEYARGGELMFNFLISKWFNINLSSNYYNYTLEGIISESEITASSNNFDARLNTNFRISPSTRLQIQGFYQGPSASAQGKRDDFFMTSAALRQEFLESKLSATVRIQDIFGTGSFRFINQGIDFYDEFNFQREPQVLIFSLSYRINNFKRQNGKGVPDNEEMDDVIMSY